MKREIVDEPELEAFARERTDEGDGNSRSIADPAPFKWIGGSELNQIKPRQKQMVVDKVLPAGGLTVIASKSKSGKTTLMIEICHAVSTGRPVLGRYEVKPGPVLYWLADDSNVERFAENWNIVTGGASVENFHLCVKRQHLYPDGIINLRKAAQEFHPVLIGVDAYTTVRTPHPKGIDFVKAEYEDMRRLSELGAETGAAIGLIHHQSKTKQADPFDAVAGSYAMSAGADGRMVVEKLQNTERLVRVDGRDVDSFEFVYARGKDRMLFHVIDGPAASQWDRLHSVAQKWTTKVYSTKDAGEIFGVSDRQARRILVHWEQTGALVEVERGRYTFDTRVIDAADRIAKATKG